MLEKDKRIQDLLTQYVNQTISESDFKFLFEEIKKEEHKELLHEFMKQYENVPLNIEADDVDWSYMYDHILAESKPKKSSWIGGWQKLTIAASLILAGYIGYQFYKDKKLPSPTETVIVNDASPGGEKAILRLSDGSQIILNDAKKGELTKQGNANISKNDDDLIAYASNNNPVQQVYTNVLSTPRGGQYRLMLPDQTMVWLNAESSITFPTAFIGKERRVKITGEVYFEVSKNKEKPFIVESNQANVEVLGTHFNFNTYPNEEQQSVTLLEGSIKLTHGKESTFVSPGQRASFNLESDLIKLKQVDIDNVVDWKNGLFIFEDASVKEVMRQVERWYDVKTVYVGRVPNVKLNGVISRDNNLSKLIKLLEKAGNISFDIQHKTVTVKQLNK